MIVQLGGSVNESLSMDQLSVFIHVLQDVTIFAMKFIGNHQIYFRLGEIDCGSNSSSSRRGFPGHEALRVYWGEGFGAKSTCGAKARSQDLGGLGPSPSDGITV